MSDLVRNQNCCFSHAKAHLMLHLVLSDVRNIQVLFLYYLKLKKNAKIKQNFYIEYCIIYKKKKTFEFRSFTLS